MLTFNFSNIANLIDAVNVMYTPPYYPVVVILQQKLKTILAPYLGTYGATLPAIWVEPPSTPKEPCTGGLECVIKRFKNVSTTELLLNNQAHDTFEWLVTLKSNERTPEIYKKFDQAISTMRQHFPDRRESIADFDEKNTLIATYRLPEEEIYNVKY